jgi:hypothetical protein
MNKQLKKYESILINIGFTKSVEAVSSYYFTKGLVTTTLSKGNLTIDFENGDTSITEDLGDGRFSLHYLHPKEDLLTYLLKISTK